MKCISCELLDLAAPILRCPDADFSGQIKALLQKVTSHCRLRRGMFFRCSPGGQDFSRAMHFTGETPVSPSPFPFDSGTATEVLSKRQCQRRDNAVYLPVAAGKTAIGILVFEAEPDKSDFEPCFPAFHHLAAFLAQVAATEKKDAETAAMFDLTTRLLHGLGRSRSLSELMQALMPVLLEGAGAAAVLLRPIYGGTLVDRPYYRIQSEFRDSRATLLALEEMLTGKVLLEDGHPQLLTPEETKEKNSGGVSLGAAVLPLHFQNRPVGILTLLHAQNPPVQFLSWAAGENGPLENLAALFAHGLERIALQDRLDDLIRDSDRKMRETHLLYRISRALHSTLRLNDLMHLALSAATVSEGGGFERAMLFMVNERTGMLQGMLGVTRETATLVLPPGPGRSLWDRPQITDQAREAQHQDPLSGKVKKLRLPLDPHASALGRAVGHKRVIFVHHPEEEPEAGRKLAADMDLASYACAPLLGQEGPLGVLVVDNPDSGEPIAASRLEFLEVFANQAGVAMENSLLMHRLEAAHLELKNTQDRLIQGEKMAVLGEMAASVAHELKNPLVAVGGFAQRLARLIQRDGEEREYAEIIAREVRRMEEMLSNILSFSKRPILCFEECTVEQVIREALALEGHALTRSKVHLDLEIDPDLPVFQGDEQKLRQVLVNLMTNARQAMPRGGRITIRARSSLLRGKPAVLLEIEDTGGGISSDIQESIFTPFFTTKDRGTGLGLSISQRIIEQHQGEIEARNGNQGAVFTIRLPVSIMAGLS